MSREAKARWDEQRRADRQARRRAHYRAGCRPAAVACWQISKQHNVGSLIRTAHAAGLDEVVLVAATEEWNLAAAKSAEIYTPIVHLADAEAYFAYCAEKNWTPVAVETAEHASNLWDVDYPERPCFFLGAELGGLPDEVLERIPTVVRIPQWGLVPSLNVAIAGSIVLYHWLGRLAASGRLPRPAGGLVEPWPPADDPEIVVADG